MSDAGTRPWARLLPPWVVAGVLYVLGARRLAVVVVVLGTAVAVSAIASPAMARRWDRLFEWVARTVGRVATFLLLAVVQVLIVIPVSLVLWLTRRDPLRLGADGPGWRRCDSSSAAEVDLGRRPFGIEQRPTRGRVGRALALVPRIVGVIAVIGLLDLAIGSSVRDPEPPIATSERLAAARAELPWFADYQRELADVEYETAYFVLSEPVDHAGTYINVEDGLRQTSASEPSPDLPVVWIFGGSPAWGEGQRDAHTVASELTAIAADAGTPVQVVNRAQRGDTVFVEAQRLERALAHEAPPDLVLFLDGPDDVRVQADNPTGHPGQYGLQSDAPVVVADDRSAWERYLDVSVLYEIGQRIRSVFAAAPAWADTPVDPQSSQTREDVVAAATAEVYERGRHLTAIVSERAGVPVRHYWMPVAPDGDLHAVHVDTHGRLATGVTALPELDESDGVVYLDGVHTTERGARQVAEALYDDLAPTLAELDQAR